MGDHGVRPRTGLWVVSGDGGIGGRWGCSPEPSRPYSHQPSSAPQPSASSTGEGRGSSPHHPNKLFGRRGEGGRGEQGSGEERRGGSGSGYVPIHIHIHIRMAFAMTPSLAIPSFPSLTFPNQEAHDVTLHSPLQFTTHSRAWQTPPLFCHITIHNIIRKKKRYYITRYNLRSEIHL